MNLRRLLLVGFASTVLTIAGCFFPLVVTQPETAEVGEKITVSLYEEMDEASAGGAGGGPSAGLCAVLMDTNWTISRVEYDGDYGPDEMVYLHPDSADSSPDKGVDYWHDSLVVRFPPPPGMDWYVYESDEFYYYLGDTTSVTIEIDMTVTTANTVDLGYFVTTHDWSFDSESYYTVSLGNTIAVSPSAIELDDNAIVAKKFGLDQNYPNPFNPSTTIRYQLEKTGEVRLSVFDLAGKEIAVLVNGSQNAGDHQVEFRGENLSSGVYLYRLVSGDQSFVRKMMLVK